MASAIANVARFLTMAASRDPLGLAVRAPIPRRSKGPLRYVDRTFRELEDESNAMARLFARRGVQRGQRVLVMVRPGLDLIRVTFALFKMGAVPVVIDPGMGMRSFLKCVRHTAPEAMVGIPMARFLSGVFRGAFSGVRVRVTLGAPRTRREFEQNVLRGESPILADTGPADLAAILFTSGSTGPAKGVCYEHGMFEAQVRLIRRHYHIQAGEIDLPMLPIFALFNPALGMATVVPEINPGRPASVAAGRIVEAIQVNGVTNSFGSPAIWNRIVQYCEQHNIVLPGMRRVLVAGAPSTPSLLDRLQRLLSNGHVYTPYGATESLPVTSISAHEVLAETCRLTMRGGGACVGRPLDEMSVIIKDDKGNALASSNPSTAGSENRIGTILVSGPVVTRSYYNLPDETRASKEIDAQGRLWHRIGDVGYIDAEGRLWFCGRYAERVVTENGILYPECCEPIFNNLAWVARSALVGLGEPGTQVPAIVIEPKTDFLKSLRVNAESFLRGLRNAATSAPTTTSIGMFFLKRKFPVDVRHNAKIHRLSLRRMCMRKTPRCPDALGNKITSDTLIWV